MTRRFILFMILSTLSALSLAADPLKLTLPKDQSSFPKIEGFLYELRTPLPADDAPHAVTVLFRAANGDLLVEQHFTFRLKPHHETPLLTLLRDADARRLVLSSPNVSVKVSSADEVQLSLGELRSSDRVLRARTDVAAAITTLETGNGRLNGVKVVSNTTFLCPEADQDECFADYSYCIDTCEPQDAYRPCDACGAQYHDCSEGVGNVVWTEETIVSTTPVSSYACTITGSATYQIYSRQIHHVEYQERFCPKSGNYTIVTADYYQTINCYQYRAPGCPPYNTDIVDPSNDCII